jgi:Transposase
MIACASGKKEASTLEQTRGPLIYALLEYPFFVLYPVNPATTARYRQAFKTSRAKDDPSDAQICLELLLHHREKLTPWLPEDAQTRELSCLLQHRRTAVDLRTLLSNMLRATRSRVIIPRPSSWPARISLPRLAASSCSNGLRSRSCRKRAKKACASFTTHTIAGAWMSSLD